ncbi:GAF domain-containing protein [Streptomyces leeuwenhoekii]|uniref:Redox sensor histidine kinase response regulator devS n=1 Tax=Streptomyces leeuwenhoekii TaxID=1437453 RepID=A0A0F7W564_STRLW|nr:GAF domain-containing protein [Streptomyces leeuwenhoekii]CQR64221.1 Redox sensor histidine kinase response regulator devS [Streptomyces leeuwenhoekii]
MTDAPRSRLALLLEAVLGVGTDLDPRGTLLRLVDGAAELTGAAHAWLSTTGPAPDVLTGISSPAAPPGVPDTPHRLRVPIHVEGEEFGALHLAGRAGGGPFTAADEQLLRFLAAQAGIAIANARLYGTARQRERWIEGAAAVTTALLTGDAAGDALTTVAKRARRLADAAAGVVLQPTGEGGMEIVAVSAPDDPGGLAGATIPPGSPVLEQLFAGEPVFVEDAATDPRMTTPVRHRFGPGMMLPLRAGGRLIGTLALPRRRGDRPYTGVERALAVQFASQAAVALVLADARRGRERLAVYEDRDRIARDLHDLVVQRLFATGLMLESTQRRTGAGDVEELVDRAVDDLRSTVREVRAAILALQRHPEPHRAGEHPAAPARGPAPAATVRDRVLRETAAAAARLGFAPSTRFTGAVDSRVPGPVADRLLGALRRALAAACGRPGVGRVEVTVDATATLPDGREAVRLTVRDDGGAGEDGGGTTVTWECAVRRAPPP